MYLFGDVYGLLLVAVVFIITFYIWKRLTNPLPPGPTPLPIFGNTSLTLSKKPVMSVLQELAKKYGRVMTVHIGPLPFVILNDFDTIKEAFVTQSNDFASRTWSLSGDIMAEGHKDIALSDFGPEWSLHRRLAMMALKKFADKNTVSDLVCESTTDVCEIMVEETEKRGKTGDMEMKIYLLIYNVIASIVFGKKFKSDDEDFTMLTENITYANEITSKGLWGDYIPILRFLPLPDGKRKLQIAMDKIFVFINRNVAEHNSTLDMNNARDITDSIIIARAEMEREGKEDMSFFTDVHLRQTISDIFFAGTDTTCFTLIWVILYSVAYPELQEKVYAEIQAAVGDRMITKEDRGGLTYTEAFLLEVMRVRPIAPLSLPHAPSSDQASVGGYHIPRGTNVLPNIWACHYDPAYWSEPDRFNPDRFIKDGRVVSKPDSFLPFSIGRRACAGEQLARVDNLLIFATLIQRVKFSTPSQGGSDPPSLEPRVEGGLFFCAARPYDIKVTRR